MPPKTTNHTTIHDVAKHAGVATTTVSRVLNNSGYVAQPMRLRVEAAIAELGYVPNSLARSLRSRRTHTLALVLTDITNPFFTTVARGVEDAASAAGYTVVLCNTDERESKEQEYLQMLLQKRVDGILLVPAPGAGESLRVIGRQQTPVVVLDRRAGGGQADVVRCNSEGGAFLLGRLLVSLGHRAFAVLTGPAGVSTSEDRVTGFRRALEDAGLPDATLDIHYGDFTQESGMALTRCALAAAPLPTALFATNNFLALGALRALREAGLRVPEDVALVGFDDLPASLVTFPFLTVATQPAYEMGRQATELLLSRLDGRGPEGFQEIVLDGALIARASSGGPRRDAL